MAKVQKVRANENIEVINHILEQDGCIVIEDVLVKHELDKLKRELDPHFDETPNCTGDFYGHVRPGTIQLRLLPYEGDKAYGRCNPATPNRVLQCLKSSEPFCSCQHAGTKRQRRKWGSDFQRSSFGLRSSDFFNRMRRYQSKCRSDLQHCDHITPDPIRIEVDLLNASSTAFLPCNTHTSIRVLAIK